MTDRPSFSAVVVAAGKGLRAGQAVPKQFVRWHGKPVLAHSLERLSAAGAERIVAVVPDPRVEVVTVLLEQFANLILVEGGETRQQSVLAGLQALADDAPDRVLIHDAARPDIPVAVIDRLLDALTRHEGAIPVLPVVDSLAVAAGGLMTGAAMREELRRVQTPQAFRFQAIWDAHQCWDAANAAGDDAQVALAAGYDIALVAGDEALKKLTFAGDFAMDALSIRVGTGFDVHRFGAGDGVWLCGIYIHHSHGLIGHSDADVGLHAITDAMLGAVAGGDIGQHFSPSDPQWKGASSDQFLRHAAELAADKGYAPGNVDLTIICEAPKIGPHREAMSARIGEILAIDPTRVSVKATTTERLGFTGREEGIAAQAVVTMVAQVNTADSRAAREETE